MMREEGCCETRKCSWKEDRPLTAVTIGKFDGFHLGHQLLLRTLKEFQNMEQVVCKIVFPGPGLMTIEEQETFVKEFGIHRFVKIPFSKEFAALPPETFVTDYLVKQLDVKHLVVGADFHFGYQRSGNVNTLKGLGSKYGFTVTALKKLEMDGSPISSTRIRSCYETGDVRTAMRILGRPVVIPGIVRHGKELGRTIGFPTLNLIPEEDRLMPKYGVYASRVETSMGTFSGITNIGLRPTVNKGEDVTVETYLPGFSGDLYDERIRVSLMDFIRPEQKFDSVEHLQEQMQKDVQFLDFT